MGDKSKKAGGKKNKPAQKKYIVSNKTAENKARRAVKRAKKLEKAKRPKINIEEVSIVPEIEMLAP